MDGTWLLVSCLYSLYTRCLESKSHSFANGLIEAHCLPDLVVWGWMKRDYDPWYVRRRRLCNDSSASFSLLRPTRTETERGLRTIGDTSEL
ncbi:hypothetical protein B0T17DRAFT_526372 [Bombardia bombarda]|uniref:Uncharacterized protein n=1 Tax=Bombardia bombarda TaxID=252184 RepID=A0AA40C993_9PEZI|nr:hypothetical protein B0T17DRAFT_526372 [Bombardia bombarda]